MSRCGVRSRIGVGDVRLGRAERGYVARVMRTGRLSYGPLTRRFESAFARAHGRRFGVFCNSGTSALHVSLAALKERRGWKDGDEVIVPAVTFVATPNSVLHNGLRPVFVDVDPRTYNLDPRRLEAARTRRTRAVMPVHLLGLPCDMAPIQSFARRHRLELIEDSCETTFGRYRGRFAGSFGAIGCFSTYVAHIIVTGVGGVAVTDDRRLAMLLRSLVNHGRDPVYSSMDDGRGVRGSRLREIVSRRFRFVALGHSFRCTELEAAIGLGQMQRKESFIRARRANARFLTSGLRELEDRIQLPYTPPDRTHQFMMYPIALRSGSKKGLVEFLERRGIETRDLLPLVGQPVYARLLKGARGRFPVAAWLEKSAFYVGCHQNLRRADLARVVETVRSYFRRR